MMEREREKVSFSVDGSLLSPRLHFNSMHFARSLALTRSISSDALKICHGVENFIFKIL